MLALRSRFIAAQPTASLLRAATAVSRPVLQPNTLVCSDTQVTLHARLVSTFNQRKEKGSGKIKASKSEDAPSKELSSKQAQAQVQAQAQEQFPAQLQQSEQLPKRPRLHASKAIGTSPSKPRSKEAGDGRFFSTMTQPNVAMVKPEKSEQEPGKIKEPQPINNPTSHPKPETPAPKASKQGGVQKQSKQKRTDATGVRSFSTYAQPAPAGSHNHLSQMKKADNQPNNSRTSEASEEHLPMPNSALDDDFLVFQDMTLEEILNSKPRTETFYIESDAMIFDAIKLMSEKHVGCLLVTQKGQTVGIVTERDYLRKVALKNISSRDTPVHKIMCTEVKYGTGSQLARDALKLMTDGRFRHLPVLNDRRELIGLVSIGDLVKSILSEVSETAMYYRDFVEGKYRYSGTHLMGHLKNLPRANPVADGGEIAGQPTPPGPSMASSN